MYFLRISEYQNPGVKPNIDHLKYHDKAYIFEIGANTFATFSNCLSLLTANEFFFLVPELFVGEASTHFTKSSLVGVF